LKIQGNRTCEYDYTPFNEDKENYDAGWQPYQANSTSVRNATWRKIYGAFSYRHSADLDSLPFAAQYATYMGGGYVFDITPRQNALAIQEQLSLLQDQNWVDENTRAVFIEFTLFNPNINLFAYCTISFEFLSTGNIVKSFQFNPITLYTSTTGFMLLALACNIIYIVIISFFVLKEIRSFIKIGRKKYFKQVIVYFDWLLIIFSYVALAMYMYRTYAQYELFGKLSENSNPKKVQKVIRLQKISYWTDLLMVFVSICSFIGMIKFLKVISFSRNISLLLETFKRCFDHLLNFLMVFTIIWISFVSLIFMVYNDKTQSCSNFIKTLETTFLIILGKFSTTAFTQSRPILGPLILTAYNMIIVIVLANLVMTMIIDYYQEAQTDYFAEHGRGDSIVLEYVKNKWADFRSQTLKIKGKKVKENHYIDNMELFSLKATAFAQHVSDFNLATKNNYDHILNGKPEAENKSLLSRYRAKKYQV
jgi:polycystin 1L2